MRCFFTRVLLTLTLTLRPEKSNLKSKLIIKLIIRDFPVVQWIRIYLPTQEHGFNLILKVPHAVGNWVCVP